MKNLERYYDELISCDKSPSCHWMKKIRNGDCTGIPCKECGRNFIQWLNEEHKEPIKLTKVQYEILKCLPQCSSMQMLNNEMIIHKDNLEFFLSKLGVKIIECDCEEKSIKIKDILENCEVVE